MLPHALLCAPSCDLLLSPPPPFRLNHKFTPHTTTPACSLHLYGDLYSSPGLDLRQKQLLTCAFLSEAHMPDQLFGHALAGLRCGGTGQVEGRV